MLALDAVHATGAAHRDLKMENIGIDASGYPLLLDFGHAAAMPAPGMGLLGSVGTRHMMPPEMMLGRPHDRTCDVWALGVLLVDVLTGWPPFGLDPLADARALAGGRPARLAPALRRVCTLGPIGGLSPELGDLLGGLLAWNTWDRPSWDAVRGHPWFAGLDWHALAAGRLPAPLAEMGLPRGAGGGGGSEPMVAVLRAMEGAALAESAGAPAAGGDGAGVDAGARG